MHDSKGETIGGNHDIYSWEENANGLLEEQGLSHVRRSVMDPGILNIFDEWGVSVLRGYSQEWSIFRMLSERVGSTFPLGCDGQRKLLKGRVKSARKMGRDQIPAQFLRVLLPEVSAPREWVVTKHSSCAETGPVVGWS